MNSKLFNITFLVALLTTSTAYSVDYDEYARLVTEAQAAQDAYDAASADERATLAQPALEAGLAVIEWLDVFVASEEFAQLAPEQMSAVYSDRYRQEYNVSLLLISMDHCEDARDRLDSLLDSVIDDEQLLSHVTQTYDQAMQCLAHPITATVSVDCTPSHAETTGKLPVWYEWTLWGVGAAGLGTGLAVYLSARQHEYDIEHPPPGQVVTGLPQERDVIDDWDTTAFIVGGVGLVSIATATILYLIRDGDETREDAVTWGVELNRREDGVWLRVQF